VPAVERATTRNVSSGPSSVGISRCAATWNWTACRGAKAQIAREFKVARSTITRDIRQWSGDQYRLCATCFRPTLNDDWDWIIEVQKKELHVENPLHYAAQARRDATRAIRDELPHVLADLGVFVNDPDDEDPTAGTPHAVVLPTSGSRDMRRR